MKNNKQYLITYHIKVMTKIVAQKCKYYVYVKV